LALRSSSYEAAEPLVRKHLSLIEWPETAGLIHELRVARKRGYLRSSELEAVCYWKSPRAIQRIKSNSSSAIRAATRAALAARSERARLEALTALSGVSVPMASAVLTLLDPKRYGVIDIRVWELLYALGTVTRNPGAVGFSFNNWHEFLMIIRHFAKKLECKARDIERTLFMAHKQHRKGRLYGGR
jgi:hypothetical protein